jgi:hypothetical protein
MRLALAITGLVLAGLALFPGEARAGYDCNPPGTVIVYGNGMNTSRIQARASMVALQKSLTDLDDPDVRFDLAYNEREGDLEQLLEVYIQHEGEELEDFWREIAGSDWMPDFLKDAWEKAARDFREDQLNSDADLRRHVQMYRALILEGNKVLVVSHSQGNFYANLAYDTLYSGADPVSEQSFGIVGVGTPAARVGGHAGGALPLRLDAAGQCHQRRRCGAG